jgi:hypothetical protein
VAHEDSAWDWRTFDLERDTAAYRVRNDNRVNMSRPLCPYPRVAVYKGAGDTNLASNFVCKAQ